MPLREPIDRGRLLLMQQIRQEPDWPRRLAECGNRILKFKNCRHQDLENRLSQTAASMRRRYLTSGSAKSAH